MCKNNNSDKTCSKCSSEDLIHVKIMKPFKKDGEEVFCCKDCIIKEVGKGNLVEIL